MTDPEKTKFPRNHGPLTAEQIVGKVRRLLVTQPGRIDEAASEIRRVDAEKMAVYLARASSTEERGAALDMLRAVKLGTLFTEEPSEDPPESESEPHAVARDEESEGGTALPRIEAELPKGTSDYVPGPAARAARGKR